MLDILGPGEVAELLGVTPITVARWRRDGVLPEPDAMLKRVAVWERDTVLLWARETGRLTDE
jgi:predicted site-specific integrase-resolvase